MKVDKWKDLSGKNDLIQKDKSKQPTYTKAPTLEQLKAQVDELREALKPFANYACDTPHINEPQCHNCVARLTLKKGGDK